MRSFVKINYLHNSEITLSFTDEGKSCHSRKVYVANMSFYAICENKILAKIFEFTVCSCMHKIYVNNEMYFSMCIHTIYNVLSFLPA